MRISPVSTCFKLSPMTWSQRWRRESWAAASVLAVIGAVAFLLGCSGSSKVPVPSILNVNSSTNPSSPVGLPIEINGSGFLSSPGQVVFTQSSSGIKATVMPSASGWSDTGVVVTVPAGNGTSSFTLPGTIEVTVVTKGGTSNAVNVDLVQTLTFDVNNVTWSTTSPLPVALTGVRAVALPVNDTNGYVVVTGGYDGTSNTTTVFSNTIAADGTLGANWQSITTTPLPLPRAHHGMAEADPGNSLVPVDKHFIYVIGGQENSTDTPGGTNTVFMASADPTTGGVGTWTQLPTNLPESLIPLKSTPTARWVPGRRRRIPIPWEFRLQRRLVSPASCTFLMETSIPQSIRTSRAVAAPRMCALPVPAMAWSVTGQLPVKPLNRATSTSRGRHSAR